MFLYSLIAGSIEASIDIMAKVIPFVLKVIFVVVIVIPLFIIGVIFELIKQFICYIRKEEYKPSTEPAKIKDILPQPKPQPKKVKVVRQTPKKKAGGITVEEMILYDIIDDD